MRRISKKLSVLLAIILVFTSVNITNYSTAKAATSPTWNNISKNKKVLYVGKKFTLTIKNKASGMTYKWSSSDTNIASVSKTGTVTAKKVGTAVIKCTIKKSNSTKVYKTLKATFTIKESASSISITNPVTSMDVKSNAYDFNAQTKTVSGNNSTDKVYWILSENTAGATVDQNGTVSTAKVGQFKIQAVTATSDTNYKAGKYTSVSEIVTVQVPLSILSVRQIADQKIEIQFNSNAKDLIKLSDLALLDVTSYAYNQLKGISFSSNGELATVETYMSLNTSHTYKLMNGSKEYNFQSSTGDIASIVIKTNKIPYATASEIEYAIYDSNGTDITSSKKNTAVIDVELIDITKGYIDSNHKLTLLTKGDSARIRITYHTFKYVNGSEVVITAEGLVTAVDQLDQVVGNYEKYTIAKSSPNWSALATTVNTLSISDMDYSIYLLVKDSNNIQIPASSIKYSSSDDNKLLVTESGALCPLREGNVYVIATVGAKSWTLPITIIGERKASAIYVDKPTVTLSNSIYANDTATIKVSVKDQYGNDYKSDTLYVENVTEANSRIGAPTATIKGSNVIFYGVGAYKGEYNFIITAAGKKISVIVRVVEPTSIGQSIYNIDLSKDSIDTAITDSTQISDKSIEFRVGEYKNGILYNYKIIKSIIITNPDNTTAKYNVNSTSYTFNAVSMSSGGISKASTGNYKVTFIIADENGKDISISSGFKIYDTQQTMLTYSINSLSTYKNTIRYAIADCIQIKDPVGNLLDSSNIVSVSYKSAGTILNIDSVLSAGTKVYIESITVKVKVGNNYVQQTIAIGQTFLIQ